MNDFRIPPHTAVKLVFGRKVLRDEFNEQEVCCIDGFVMGQFVIIYINIFRVSLEVPEISLSAHSP